MNSRKKASVISATIVAAQAVVAVALYFFGIVTNLERLLIITIFVGVMVSNAYVIVPSTLDLLMTPSSAMMVAEMSLVGAGLLALWTGVIDTSRLPIQLILAATLAGAGGVMSCDVHGLNLQIGKRKSFLLPFAILVVPQFCIFIIAAVLL